MRILVASDLHYGLPHYDWLVRAADDVDVVALAGDLAASWLCDLRQDTLLCDGASVDLDGIRFTVCPWWDGPATRDAVAAQLAAAAVDRPATWVSLYHAPPAGTVLCNDGRRVFPDLVGTWLAGRQRVGWLVCIVFSMLWVPTLVTGDQWAAIANCGVSVAICAHNFLTGHESRSPGQPCGDQAPVAEGKGFEPLMSLHS